MVAWEDCTRAGEATLLALLVLGAFTEWLPVYVWHVKSIYGLAALFVGVRVLNTILNTKGKESEAAEVLYRPTRGKSAPHVQRVRGQARPAEATGAAVGVVGGPSNKGGNSHSELKSGDDHEGAESEAFGATLKLSDGLLQVITEPHDELETRMKAMEARLESIMNTLSQTTASLAAQQS